jgi:carboxymethylenebutenolidase
MSNKLEHHQQYLIEEFAEDYLAHRLLRRDLLRRVLILTGSVPLTASMLLALGCGDSSGDDDEPAAQPTNTAVPLATTEAGVGPGVAPTDPAVQAQDVRFPGPATELLGYLARPSASGPFPGVLVIPENAGLLDHFKDVARRFAKEGFVALALDPISRSGGTTPNMEAVTAAYRAIDGAQLTEDMKAAVGYLKSQSFVRANAIGATGFCFGGGQTWEIALASPDVKAAVPFYGSLRAELVEPLGQTQVAFSVMYGETDTRITGQREMVEERLRAAGRPYEINVYQGAPHAFFNETKPNSYNQAAAVASWKSMLAWFRRYLTA